MIEKGCSKVFTCPIQINFNSLSTYKITSIVLKIALAALCGYGLVRFYRSFTAQPPASSGHEGEPSTGPTSTQDTNDGGKPTETGSEPSTGPTSTQATNDGGKQTETGSEPSTGPTSTQATNDGGKQTETGSSKPSSHSESFAPGTIPSYLDLPNKMTIPKEFDTAVVNWPDEYRKIILDYYVTNGLLDNLAIFTTEKHAEYAYKAIANHFKSSIEFSAGYFYFKPGELMRGTRVEKSYRHWASEVNRNLAAQNYKIHLMPKTEDIPRLLIRLLEELRNNHSLSSEVFELKVLEDTQNLSGGFNEILPILVIYPSSGKEPAQKVLNAVYNLSKDFSGLDITPRYNEKVTSLLYFSQGNGRDKKGLNFYFSDDRICYKSNFVNEKVHVDYTLTNPATVSK